MSSGLYCDRIGSIHFLTEEEKLELGEGDGAILIDPMGTFPGTESARSYHEVVKLFDSCIKSTLMTGDGRVLVYCVNELTNVMAWDFSDSDVLPESGLKIDVGSLTNNEIGFEWDAFESANDHLFYNTLSHHFRSMSRYPIVVDFESAPEGGEIGFEKDGCLYKIM